MGVDEQVLSTLQQQWEQRLLASGVLTATGLRPPSSLSNNSSSAGAESATSAAGDSASLAPNIRAIGSIPPEPKSVMAAVAATTASSGAAKASSTGAAPHVVSILRSSS